jgi:hypothetical protein
MNELDSTSTPLNEELRPSLRGTDAQAHVTTRPLDVHRVTQDWASSASQVRTPRRGRWLQSSRDGYGPAVLDGLPSEWTAWSPGPPSTTHRTDRVSPKT